MIITVDKEYIDGDKVILLVDEVVTMSYTFGNTIVIITLIMLIK